MRLYLYHIDELVEMRAKARENKDWAFADEIRNYLDSKGAIIMDTKDGQEVYHTKETREQLIKRLSEDKRLDTIVDAWIYSMLKSSKNETDKRN